MALTMERLVLDFSVGPNCNNTRMDILRVQFALNSIAPAWGGPKKALPFDGKYDKRVSEALKGFQIHCFSRVRKATGKIEPNDPTHRKINQVLSGSVDLVAITSHGGSAIEKGAKAFDTEIRFDGITDLVAKVKAALQDKAADPSFRDAAMPKKIANLSVSSHGAPGFMSLSSSSRREDLILAQYEYDDVVNYRPDELLDYQEKQLSLLRGCFVREGLVTLSACSVAAPKNIVNKKKSIDYRIDGQNFLKATSRALGNIAVQAGTAKQYDAVFGMEGPCYRCDSHCCILVSPKQPNFFGPDFLISDEFGNHYADDVLAEESLAAVSSLPVHHPEKLRLMQRLFNRKRKV